jgi:hypothetical protein
VLSAVAGDAGLRASDLDRDAFLDAVDDLVAVLRDQGAARFPHMLDDRVTVLGNLMAVLPCLLAVLPCLLPAVLHPLGVTGSMMDNRDTGHSLILLFLMVVFAGTLKLPDWSPVGWKLVPSGIFVKRLDPGRDLC